MSKDTALLGREKSTQKKPFTATTTIVNADGDVIAWDAIEEAVHCTPFCNKDEKMTAAEAARHFKVDQQGIYARARRHKWKLVDGHKREGAKRAALNDWAKRGEAHREIAFAVGHESVKKFKARPPKTFRDLEIADRIARRAAGLETAEVVQQTLVHINEAIDDHGDQQVIEASVFDTLQSDQANPTAPLQPELTE
jgi:hypothetical protein